MFLKILNPISAIYLNNNNERYCRKTTTQAKTPKIDQFHLPLLQPGISLLLAVPVRLPYLSGVYA